MQTLPAQENGVTSTGTQFGPANREYYDPSSWALTTFSTSREIIDHPPPSKRRRIDDEPAFLRGSKETDYLGPLLTIYHSIPLAREALLMPGLKVHAYDHDNTWWAGTTDENTKALSTDSSLRVHRDELNVLAEVQCLMGLLDKTTRAYGSVDALADLQAVRSCNGDSSFLRFLMSWSSAALGQEPHEQLTQVFTTVAMKNNEASDDEPQEKSLLFVEAPINRVPGETLVDLLDMTVWNDDTGNIDDVWIDHAAEIFTVRVYVPDGGKEGIGLTLEPVWYPDRYMDECREAMQHIRHQAQSLRKDIDQCTNIQRRHEAVKLPDNRVLMIRDVLDAAAKASAAVIGKKQGSGRFYDSQRSLSEDPVAQADVEAVNAELANVLGKIEQRIQQLEQKKTELRSRMRQVALQLTRPTRESPHLPHCKYTLQGVSTKPNITYVRQSNKDLLHLDDDDATSEDPDTQWWKMAWLPDDKQNLLPPTAAMGPTTQTQAEAQKKHGRTLDEDAAEDEGPKAYTVRKVSENEVLEAVKDEHHSVLLVFANEKAMTFNGSELSLPLRHFIDRDNQAFADELQEEEGPILDTPADREAEVEFEDVPLIDQNGSSSSAQELTPMSTSSLGRDENGQPSPKRVKEGDGGLYREPPPSYIDSVGKQEMQERRANRIGLYAEQMLQKYGGDIDKSEETTDGGNFTHVERLD